MAGTLHLLLLLPFRGAGQRRRPALECTAHAPADVPGGYKINACPSPRRCLANCIGLVETHLGALRATGRSLLKAAPPPFRCAATCSKCSKRRVFRAGLCFAWPRHVARPEGARLEAPGCASVVAPWWCLSSLLEATWEKGARAEAAVAVLDAAGRLVRRGATSEARAQRYLLLRFSETMDAFLFAFQSLSPTSSKDERLLRALKSLANRMPLPVDDQEAAMRAACLLPSRALGRFGSDDDLGRVERAHCISRPFCLKNCVSPVLLVCSIRSAGEKGEASASHASTAFEYGDGSGGGPASILVALGLAGEMVRVPIRQRERVSELASRLGALCSPPVVGTSLRLVAGAQLLRPRANLEGLLQSPAGGEGAVITAVRGEHVVYESETFSHAARLIKFFDGTVAATGTQCYQGLREAVASGELHAAASIHANEYGLSVLREDGAVLCYANPRFAFQTAPLAALDVVAVAATVAQFLALRQDGSLNTWGNLVYQEDLPERLAKGRFKEVRSLYESLQVFVCLRDDGCVIAWWPQSNSARRLEFHGTDEVLRLDFDDAAEAMEPVWSGNETVALWLKSKDGARHLLTESSRCHGHDLRNFRLWVRVMGSDFVSAGACDRVLVAVRRDGSVRTWATSQECRTATV